MPTYEYECEACGKGFEIEQRITEDRLKKCPKCGKLKLKRLVGTGNFILKGGGWYSDLYSSPPPGSSKSSASESSSSSSSNGTSKPESKPEPKPKKEKKLSSKGK
ncbi:MAG: zinc ribbon domain-containing protein [Polyangiales bacterium]